jgi:hypothetical protein
MRNSRTRPLLEIVLPLAVTLICGLAAYVCLGRPAIIGIDDENITQVYAHNVANGFGYVYTPGYERVEGATSPLWFLIHCLIYKISYHPEGMLLLCSIGFTWWAINSTYVIAKTVVGVLNLPSWTTLVPVLTIAVSPNYFAWTIVSMMDQAAWSAVLLALIAILVRHASGPDTSMRTNLPALLLCVLAILARPESLILLPAIMALIGDNRIRQQRSSRCCRLSASVWHHTAANVNRADKLSAILLWLPTPKHLLRQDLKLSA